MDLYGWDFACACSSDALNKLFALQFKATPASLNFDDGAGTTINAQFDAWRIVSGGSDKKLHIELPVKTGTVATPLASAAIDGVVIVAEIELAFVLNSSTKTSDLKFSFTSVTSQLNDPKAGSILIVTADRDKLLAKLPSGGALAMTLHDNVPLCLIANNAKLSYVFTSLNLTPTGGGAWFKPQNTTYIYVQGGTGSSSYLALLGMISNADTSKLPRAIDPSLCDGKNDVCIAFAGGVFLEHVVKPKLPACYVGATASNFVMVDIPNVGPSAAQRPDRLHAGAVVPRYRDRRREHDVLRSRRLRHHRAQGLLGVVHRDRQVEVQFRQRIRQADNVGGRHANLGLHHACPVVDLRRRRTDPALRGGRWC